MELTIQLPEELATFAKESADLLEYESVDAFIAALLRRQKEALTRALTQRDAAVEWRPDLHRPIEQRLKALQAAQRAAG